MSALVGSVATAAIACVAALAITLDVGGVAERALRNDIAVEDHGDDLRVAVLDLRHFHRNIVFGGPSASRVAELESGYSRVLEVIERLRGVSLGPHVATPDEMLALANRYWVVFTPAVDSYRRDPPAFGDASDEGLELLGQLEADALAVDRLGEQLAAAALTGVDEATDRAVWTLVAVILVLGTTGLALAYAGLRVLREMRLLYAAQQEATARSEAALRAKAHFIADASHELRTPLTVLRGNAEVGLATREACSHQEVLREIVADAARMTRLVEDLLFLARSDAGSVPLELRPVSLEPWTAEVAARAEMLCRERGARFRARLAAAGEAAIDSGRVEQAVLALVDNAAKFSASRGTVALSIASQGGSLVIEVADDGPGIPESELRLVFERFYRLDKTRARGGGGTGLGLAIVKSIIEAHGGRVEAESKEGTGTTMRLILPDGQAARPHAPDALRAGGTAQPRT